LFFSIIIPTYNRSYCIDKTIKSILDQNFISFEIIVIDDGSQDNTYQVIEPYLNNNKLIYKKFEKNLGPNVAKNYGSKLSSGEYLIFLDSDDTFYTSNSLNEIFSEIQNKHFSEIFMFSSYYLKQKIFSKINFEVLNFKQALQNLNNGEYLPVIRKNVFSQYNFIESLRGGEGLTWLLIIKKYNKIYYSKIPVRIYNNINDDNLSNKNNQDYSKRLYKIHLKKLNIFWKDLFFINISDLLYTLIKISLYYFGIKINSFFKNYN
jgi:glycosyltransferase involved in cell wall biosynthesis